ncbi:MAG: GntR family transcriptional regulator [Desulfobacterales bacterium]|nr:GntR family transcriptional regulator [Desulfobacterales bacterium]
MNRIEKGEYGPGDMIPTEKELARAFGVSIGTVKTALLNLVHSGLLFRVQGKGTFVSGSMLGRDQLRLYHFVSDFENQDAPLKIRFLGIARQRAAPPACRYLNIAPGGAVIRLDRIFTLKNAPVVYASSFLPGSRFEGIDRFPRETFENKPLYQLIEDVYKLPTLRYQEMFAASLAHGGISGHLKVPDGFPLLQVDMLALSFKNRPIEFRTSYCRTDGVKLFRMPVKMRAPAK